METAMWYVVPLVVALFGLVVFFMVAGKIGSSGNNDEAPGTDLKDSPPR